MAPTLADHWVVPSAAADNTTLTKSSYAVNNGDIIALGGTTWDTTHGMSTPTCSGQTVNTAEVAAPGGFNGWAGAWWIKVSGSPGTITISMAPADTANTRHTLFGQKWTGADVDATPAVNATVTATGTTAAVGLTTAHDSSAIAYFYVDDNSRDPASTTYQSGATQVDIYDGHVGSNSVQADAWQPATTAGAQTIGISNSASLALCIVGFEIKAAAASLTGDVSMSSTTAVTATGVNSAAGGASRSTTTTITATGANAAVGGATETTTTSITAAGTNAAFGAVSASTVTAMTATGANAAPVAANPTNATTAITASAVVGSVASGTTTTAITVDATVTHGKGSPRHGVTGWDLYSTLAEQAAYIDYYRTVPPSACPRCGWPLQQGPPDSPGVRYCPHGDFEYPRDWDPDTMGGL